MRKDESSAASIAPRPNVLVGCRASPPELTVAQIEYGLHHDACGHVPQCVVRIFQVITSFESRQIKPSRKSRQSLDVAEIVLLGESSGPEDAQLFPGDQMRVEWNRAGVSVLPQWEKGSAAAGHLPAFDHRLRQTDTLQNDISTAPARRRIQDQTDPLGGIAKLKNVDVDVPDANLSRQVKTSKRTPPPRSREMRQQDARTSPKRFRPGRCPAPRLYRRP